MLSGALGSQKIPDWLEDYARTKATNQLATASHAAAIQLHDSTAQTKITKVSNLFLDESLGNPKWRNMSLAKDEIKSTLRKFAQLGIHVRITELDLFDVMSDDDTTKQKKAEIYKTIVESCFEINAEFGYPVVDNITTWGIKNDESWQYYVKGRNFGYPLYFDKDFNPEPAFYEMLKVFYENKSK